MALIGLPIFIAFTYILVSAVAKDKSYPNFKVEKLKHPVYSAAYYDDSDGGGGEFRA